MFNFYNIFAIFVFVWGLQLSSCLLFPVQIICSRQVLYSVLHFVTHLLYCEV